MKKSTPKTNKQKPIVLFSELSPFKKQVGMALILAGVGYAIYKTIKNREERLLAETKQKIFDIITSGCSSMGINKIKIVDEIGLIIEVERKTAKNKIAELEAEIEKLKTNKYENNEQTSAGN